MAMSYGRMLRWRGGGFREAVAENGVSFADGVAESDGEGFEDVEEGGEGSD